MSSGAGDEGTGDQETGDQDTDGFFDEADAVGASHEADDLDDFDDEYDDEFEEDFGNRLPGATPRAVLEYVARSMVDDPDAVMIDVEERRGAVTLRLHVAPGDMGKVIGRRGRVAQAIRAVVRAAGARDEVAVNVDIVD
jgi:predicted RNA-binding protein YlqC (UPF0109 family)